MRILGLRGVEFMYVGSAILFSWYLLPININTKTIIAIIIVIVELILAIITIVFENKEDLINRWKI